MPYMFKSMLFFLLLCLIWTPFFGERGLGDKIGNMVCRILAPTTYIFFASAIPVISFGEQLERSTGMINELKRHSFAVLEKK